MAKRRQLVPLDDDDAENTPEKLAGHGPLNGVLVAGIDTLTKNRPDVTPILAAAKAAKSAL